MYFNFYNDDVNISGGNVHSVEKIAED